MTTTRALGCWVGIEVRFVGGPCGVAVAGEPQDRQLGRYRRRIVGRFDARRKRLAALCPRRGLGELRRQQVAAVAEVFDLGRVATVPRPPST